MDSRGDAPDRGEASPSQIESIRRHIEEDLAGAHARYVEKTGADKSPTLTHVFALLSEMFEIHAHHHRYLVIRYADVDGWFKRYLIDLTGNVLAEAEERLKIIFSPISKVHWPVPASREFIEEMKRHLVGRRSYWKAQALKHVRESGRTGETSSSRELPKVVADPRTPVSLHSIDGQINALLAETLLTQEELAAKIKIDVRTVQRHLSGDSTPYKRHISAYQRVFSKLLNRQVVIKKMP